MLLSRIIVSTVAAATVLVAITACGGSSGSSSPTAATTTSTTTSATTSAAPSANASEDSTSDSPTFVSGGAALGDNDTLVEVLEAVNPKIGTNKDDLIAKSKALCSHVDSTESGSQLEADASAGFTNGSWVPSESEAEAIVGTVKAYGSC